MDTNSLSDYDNQEYLRFTSRFVIERDLQVLLGMLQGIECDKVINALEIERLFEWMVSKPEYDTKQPFKGIFGMIEEAVADNVLTTDEYNDIKWVCNQYLDGHSGLYSVDHSILDLQGIVAGIAFDGEINERELLFLDKWLDKNTHLKNYWPYDELCNMVTEILRDKKVTPEELNELLMFCNSFELSGNSNTPMYADIQKGHFQVDPEIIIAEKNFCITGVSAKHKRREIAERIELFGGYVNKNLTKDAHYLVVCDEKNSCWAFTCYGRKVEKAIRFRKEQQLPIAIIHEIDLFDKFKDLE